MTTPTTICPTCRTLNTEGHTCFDAYALLEAKLLEHKDKVRGLVEQLKLLKATVGSEYLTIDAKMIVNFIDDTLRSFNLEETP